MRILWISDSPDTPSGFGNVTRFVCEGLARRGHAVSILGWQTRQAQEWHGCQVFPGAGSPLGSEAVFPLLVRCRPEIVIALADVWWMPFLNAPHVRRQMELADAPWALYFPIDGDMAGERLPASWQGLLREVDMPIAMSRYGQRIVEQADIPCHYIPHGVDLDIFCPPADRDAAKARIGAEGRFLILSDARNQPRKMLPRLLDVIAKFAPDHPKALFHLHTDPDDEFTQSGLYSYDIRADLRHLKIETQVQFTPGMRMKQGGGIPLTELAAYYQAADVHLLASSGEGFGLPTLQAAAAGVIPMAGAYSASLELSEGHGAPIEIAEWSENEFGIRRALIDVNDAARKLGTFYDDPALCAECSVQSRQFAAAYSWETVVGQWDALLQSIARRRRRIERIPVMKQVPLERMGRLDPRIPAAAVTVNVVERQYGRLETGIIADSQKHLSDVRIPALQKACEVAGLRLLRSPGYLAVAQQDQEVFAILHSIFPVLGGWVPTFSTSDETIVDGLHALPLATWNEARYQLAQSILLLNMSGGIPESVLLDAALYGVPCVGTADSRVQRELWPELAAQERYEAVAVARSLLTNPAFLRSVSARARAACQAHYALDEEEAAAWLRKLHAAEQNNTK